MTFEHSTGKLADIKVDSIFTNLENPRTAFRQEELEQLQESIRQFGVQVPIAVYRSKGGYVLIDGERRWRCASKLNMKTIPALVQDEPTDLENLLLMFNIHALREQWDLLTIALKLPKIIDLMKEENGREPNEAELSVRTGLSRGIIRRCRLLINLPQKYQDMLLEEIKKPKSKQTISEDFFIEMEKSLKTVERAMPDILPDKDKARQALLKKYKEGVIANIVDLRKVGKIARAITVNADPVEAQEAIRRLLTEPNYSINDAWTETVSEAYAERDIVTGIDRLLSKLDEVEADELDDDVREKLEELVRRAQAVLEGD
ncbi:MAG TPA: ParB/RepB/Spo0J family partition protein [Kiritimatiellia bacterium]|nr:ParB/RepB/Spo0J family partition protein [Kiritimatiellia bacterium]HMP35356.1 ParB/RepB/Spo0J family partition protein [Kiritimatiellia bacterium]